MELGELERRAFVQTSDMSEKAVGYTTIGGDLEGALSVIANVPKTVVIALLERLNTRFGFKGSPCACDDAWTRARRHPGAEAELMPFDVLDACLHLYAGRSCRRTKSGRRCVALP